MLVSGIIVHERFSKTYGSKKDVDAMDVPLFNPEVRCICNIEAVDETLPESMKIRESTFSSDLIAATMIFSSFDAAELIEQQIEVVRT